MNFFNWMNIKAKNPKITLLQTVMTKKKTIVEF